ncbi:MarR family winged helix-turn-helix transcriptional regulator [Kribbella shirazensis]|jgi:DNA-binding MarR family transcriptional regulator|uniref:DNA-binding MarR family transcriptional regulator n=1 Tax=Kribbella shirazensis TaxID=1105143 RepID=A0A7X5VDE2_9ACTN|nr:MarR family transcriptional regulator [Kribbella shirazensis]NIK58462.1 DNA-binding MarR family transcriptional regulator [Kribbella shirazensis]
MASSLLLALKRAEREIELGLQPLLDEFGLTIEQWRIMAVLRDEPGQPMSVLAESAVLPAASLTRHVDKLVERGLVLRRIHPDDKRRIVTALSPVGGTVADRLADVQRSLEADVTKYFQMEIHERSSSATHR